MIVKDYSRCIFKGVGLMARINGWDSSSISTLFSSINSSGRMKTSSPMFSSVDISTYSSIKSGSYYKLVKSYYAQGLDGLPKSDVLKYLLEDNCSVVVRPSGTEPKIKFYFEIPAVMETPADYAKATAEAEAKVPAIKASMGI